MNLSEQIEEKQTELNTARDALVDLTATMEDTDESKAAVEEQTKKVEELTAELDRLNQAEAAIQKSLTRSIEKNEAPAIGKTPGARLSDKDKGDLIFKSALCTFDAYIKRVPIDQVIVDRFGDDEALKAVVSMTTKAKQDPAFTDVAGYAQELVRDSYGAFMDLLRGDSVVPQLPLNRYEFNGYQSIKIPQRDTATPDMKGAFRGEGDPIRVGGLHFGTKTLTPKTMGVIGTYSNELFERSTPNILQVIREAMINDTAEALDAVFLGSGAGVADTPDGILANLPSGDTAASGGTTTANVIGDIRGRLQSMTQQNMGRRPVWIMNPARWYGVKLAVTGAGTPAFPETVNNQLMGIPVVTSTHVSGSVVYLIDAAEIAFAGGAPRFMGTEVATIHEEGAQANVKPIVDGSTAPGVTANPVRSLYQTNSSALRALWEVDWTVMRPGAVQTITGAGW